jgi:hypothetical protein
MKKHLLEIVGFILIGVGLIGFLIPIMPSVPFILAGIGLIGADNPRLKPLMDKIKTIKEKFIKNDINTEIAGETATNLTKSQTENPTEQVVGQKKLN